VLAEDAFKCSAHDKQAATCWWAWCTLPVCVFVVKKTASVRCQPRAPLRTACLIVCTPCTWS
jgi:hypothetical protein